MTTPALHNNRPVPRYGPRLSLRGAAAARRVLAEREADKGRDSLRAYVKYAWRQVEPETPYMSNWHIDVICEYLQAVSEGHIQNLIINIPPRHMKSLAVCVFWPTWEWITQPGLRYLFSAYSGSNAVRDTIYSRRLIMSRWYQERWGYAYKLSKDVNRMSRIENTHGGFRIAHGVASGITGEGGQRIVIDDPHQLDDDLDPGALQGVAEWWDGVMSSRVNNPQTAARVIVQQRIHDRDLSGHLMAKMEEKGARHYENLVLPAEYEDQFTRSFVVMSRKTETEWAPKVQVELLPEKRQVELEEDGVGPEEFVELTADPRVDENELLWEEKMPRAELEALKTELKRKASGQLQQRPVPTEGDLFKSRYFRYWSHAPGTNHEAGFIHLDHEDKLIDLEGFIFLTVDLATSLAATADETVISAWMWTKSKHLLWLNCDHARIEGPDIVPAIRRNMNRWGAELVGIEKSGFQLSMVQTARRTGMPVIALFPDRDKRSRAIPTAVMMDGEQMFLPRDNAPWVGYAETQLLKFTGSPNDEDDVVDTASYATWVVTHVLEKPNRQRQRTWQTGRGRTNA